MNMQLARTETQPCPICGESARLRWPDFFDDRYGYPDAFPILECTGCGHMHTPAKFTVDELTRLYTQYYPRGTLALDAFAPEQEKTGFGAWRDGLRASAFRWVPRNVRVLDIGCGLGTTLAYHRARGCEAVGIEADSNVQVFAQRYGLDIRHGVFDGSQFPAGYFDYVTLDQVAEHVADPQAMFVAVAKVLKPGGFAIVTTPNARSIGARIFGQKWLNWHVPYHVQFYSRKSLKLAASQAGLRVQELRTVTASSWQLYQWYHAMAFPARGERHEFWNTYEIRKKKRISLIRILVRLLRDLNMYTWMSRLFDVLGMGDNFVIVLQKP